MKFTYNQRQYIYNELYKALMSVKVLGGKRIPDIYGPVHQTLIRESLNTFCFHSELTPEISNGKHPNSEGKKTEIVKYRFTCEFAIPVSGDKITIQTEIDENMLEKK